LVISWRCRLEMQQHRSTGAMGSACRGVHHEMSTLQQWQDHRWWSDRSVPFAFLELQRCGDIVIFEHPLQAQCDP
jgi:hypothetical protein